MPPALFTYGSLMFAEVWSRVVKGPRAQADGVVHGYARYRVRGATYPGMIAQAGGSIEGVVYFDVGADDLARLDDFEGDSYERRTVEVKLADGRQIEAQVYLFLEPADLSQQPWEPERFAMQRFLRSYL